MKEMHFDQDYILENDIVRLRPLLQTDLSNLIDFAINEPTLWQYSLQSADGKDNMIKYISKALQDRTKETSYPFIVFDKRNNKYAGSTRFYDFSKIHNTTQLGYTWYGKEFQGTGLNKECKLLMLEFAFETLRLNRVEFRADNNNKRSIAAMQSVGCQVEGVLRSNCSSPNGRRDSIILSILRSEWDDNVKKELLLKCKVERERFNKG